MPASSDPLFSPAGAKWDSLEAAEQEALLAREIWRSAVYDAWVGEEAAKEAAKKNKKQGKGRKAGQRTYEDSDND